MKAKKRFKKLKYLELTGGRNS